ncbi:MAG: hypothetical protein J1E16_09655 [Muribaculaceae bacterium]|nr:hypothetical protein [Muribaculaceae bacterium]
MDDKTIRLIQREAAEALLNIGVSLPLKEIRIPFRKRPLVLRVTMRRPSMSGQIQLARTYLSMGVTSTEIENFSKEEQMRFIADHGDKVCRMIALTLGRTCFVRPLTWFVKHFVRYEFQVAAVRKFVTLMGTDPFIPIIRSAEKSNPMKLRLSQKRKGS